MPAFIREMGTDYQLLSDKGSVLYSHYDPDIFLSVCLGRYKIARDSLARMWRTRAVR